MNDIIMHADYVPLIIPTVLIPLTLISVGISVVATFIAGLFGVKLKAEGPKQLLEVLLKPRVLLSALVLNLVFLGGFRVFHYYNTKSVVMWWIIQKHEAVASTNKYENLNSITKAYPERPHNLEGLFAIEEIWRTKLKAGSFRAPAYSGGSLFFGADDGHIYELGEDTGDIKRSFYIGRPATSMPVIHEGFLYSGEGVHSTHHARIYKINLKTGEHESAYETEGHTEGSPFISVFGGKKYLVSGAGKDGLHTLNPETMEPIWTKNPGHIDASAAVSGGRVFIGTGREKGNPKKFRTSVVSYDLATGKEIWKRDTALSVWMKAAILRDSVCFPMGELYFKTGHGSVSCYDKETGAPQYSILTDAPVASVPLVLGADFVFMDFNGSVCRIDTQKRKRKWCFEAKSKGVQMSSISYDEKMGVLGVSTSLGGAYFLNPATGSLLAHFKPEGEFKWTKTYASPLAVDGGWVFVDMKGLVRKIKLVKVSSLSRN